MVAGAPFALGPPRCPPRWRGGLLRFGITEAPATWAWGPHSIWDQRGPHCIGVGASFALVPARPHRMGVGTSFALGPPGPPPHGCGGS